MKILKKYLIFLLCLPLVFCFASCKKKTKDTDSKQNQDNPTPAPVVTEKYSVSFDYNLPEKYDYLLTDETISNVDVGTATNFPNIADSNLKKHFLGWCKEDSEEIIEGTSITATQAESISLKGKWDSDGIDKYYYTSGLTFVLEGTSAYVNGYTGTVTKIIIPKSYNSAGTDYTVTAVNSSAFTNSIVSEIILNATNIEIKESAFKNSCLSKINFDNITQICDNAFEGTKFANVTLSSSTTKISNSAFKNCKQLTSFNFNETNVGVSQHLFDGCSLLKSVTMSSKSTYIDEYAFCDCVGLTSVNFVGVKVSLINNYAFKNCSALDLAVIPKNVTFVGTDIFDGCNALTNLTVSRFYIGDTFSASLGINAASLKSLTLADDIITTLSASYFDSLTSLETFVMCNSITTIEDSTFAFCSNLKNITLSTGLNVNNVTKNAFINTKFLTELSEPLIISNVIIYVPTTISAQYEIPSGVTKINASAFAGNLTLTQITIPATVQNIEEAAFASCSNLTSVVFVENNNITEIKNSTFNNCSKLNSIDLTKLTNLTTISASAFGKIKVSNFVVPATVTNISSSAFCDANIEQFSVSSDDGRYKCSDGVLYYEYGSEKKLAFYPKQKNQEFFAVPNDVTTIEAYAFSYARYLKYVYFSQASVTWNSVLVKGESKYRAFYMTSNIIVLAENINFDFGQNLGDAHYLISTGNYTYNSESGDLSFVNSIDVSKEYYFVKVAGSVAEKYTIIYFTLTKTEGVVSIVEDTLFSIEDAI